MRAARHVGYWTAASAKRRSMAGAEGGAAAPSSLPYTVALEAMGEVHATRDAARAMVVT